MKLIDKQGRLFGKINIIDLFVLLLALYISITFFVRYRNLKKYEFDLKNAVSIKNEDFLKKEIKSELANVEEDFSDAILNLTVKFEGYIPALADNIKVGDKDEKYPFNEVIEIVSNEPKKIVGPNGVYFDKDLRIITLKLRVLVVFKNNKYLYRDQPLKIGRQFLFENIKYDINGIIFNIKLIEDCKK